MTLILSNKSKSIIEGTFLKNLSPDKLEEKLAESYLGILANDYTIFNPLANLPGVAKDRFPEYILWLMSQPDYFYFLMKYLLNIDSYPSQALAIRELFKYRFPMFLAARGFSKCVVKETYCLTDNGFKQIKDFGIKDVEHTQQPVSESLYGERTYNKIEYGWYNGIKATKKITSMAGRVIEGTLNHPLRVVDRGKIVWKNMGDIKEGDFLVVQRKYDQWKNYNNINKDAAYVIGSTICDKLNEKMTPKIIMGAHFDSIAAYIQGLFDVNGSFSISTHSVDLRIKSWRLAEEIQLLLLVFGINADIIAQCDNTYKVQISEPFLRIFRDNIGFRISYKQNLLENYCSTISDDFKDALDSDYYFDEVVKTENGISKTYDVHLCGDDHSFMTNGFISHNSFSLAVYILLRMILVPETKCVITAAGFRQAKVVFDYMETIWSKAPILQSCFKSKKNGPTHGTDVWTFRLGDSITYALPVGPDGSKVRGYRANCIDKDTLVQTSKGLIKIKDYVLDNTSYVFNLNNTPEMPIAHYKTEVVDVYELVTENGYRLKFSDLHKIYINSNGVDKYAAPKDIVDTDYIYLDNNDYFPKDCAKYNDIELTESYIRFSGIINLSSLGASEVPWYILQSPRPIVKYYLSMLFGEHWLNRAYCSNSLYKLQQIQQLLLKFNYISRIIEKDNKYCLEVLRIHLENNLSRPTEKIKSITYVGQDNLYDFTMPDTESFLGGGFVNHNCLVGEEFATSNRQVFEEVMSGFLSVASSPVEQLKISAQKETYKKLLIPIPTSLDSDTIQNQLILCGTAYYKMNHFYHYFCKWREIIKSKNDPRILEKLFDDPKDRESINPDDYCIMRIPIELITGGYMDMAQISRIKASTTKDVFMREYNAVFTDDSDGFFRKQLIDSCTIQDENDPSLFTPCLYGDKAKKYIYGVDPAYEGDNFAIVVLECHGPSRRVVYSWTTQASDHKERLKRGIIREQDYFHYCARKIRDLMKRFPVEYIVLDPLGGGRAVLEAFMDTSKLHEGEQIILPTIEPEEETKETDLMAGLHIVKIIKFTSDWISQANYALKKDMEDKNIMFPYSDDLVYTLAEYYDESMGDNKELYDTLEDCIFEIDELKKELITITVSETATGREKFDTPSIKKGINQKGRLKKDRYSALLMANWIARTINPDFIKIENPDLVNLAGFCTLTNKTNLFLGNNKIAAKLEDLYKYM